MLDPAPCVPDSRQGSIALAIAVSIFHHPSRSPADYVVDFYEIPFSDTSSFSSPRCASRAPTTFVSLGGGRQRETSPGFSDNNNENALKLLKHYKTYQLVPHIFSDSSSSFPALLKSSRNPVALVCSDSKSKLERLQQLLSQPFSGSSGRCPTKT